VLSTSTTKQKQTTILKAARALFLERGYDAVSLDDILEQVGGSKTTLYSYYGGKEGLFTAMVQDICAEKLGSLSALDVKQMDAREGLITIGQAFLAIIFQHEGRAVFRAMIAEAQRFPKLAKAFYTAGPQSMLDLIKGNMLHWQARGMLQPDDAGLLAKQFLGIMMSDFHTRSVLGLLDPMSEKQLAEWVVRGTDLFLNGASAR
jgi:AcrR family transcriptional regulator